MCGARALAFVCLAAVRSMLSNISFVYTHYYGLNTAIGGLLISVPPLCGFLSSVVAARLSSRNSPSKIMRWGMLAGVVPPALMQSPSVETGQTDAVRSGYAALRWTTFHMRPARGGKGGGDGVGEGGGENQFGGIKYSI